MQQEKEILKNEFDFTETFYKNKSSYNDTFVK